MASSSPSEAPTQAVVLAAGRGARLAPYTDRVPTALIEVSERPMLMHSLDACRRQGVDRFVVCRGWQAAAFDTIGARLGHGVQLLDCPRYAETGMLETLRLALKQLAPGGFYLVYGDIIFRPSILRQLRECEGDIAIVANMECGAKGMADVEATFSVKEGNVRVVKRIGKNRGIQEDDMDGEFAGLVKFGPEGRARLEEALARIFGEKSDAQLRLPWWLRPAERASLCDVLQYIADEGTRVVLTVAFGGWHEVNTPQDLARARNDTSLFLSEADSRAQVAAMGRCLLAEANDLKRPLDIVSKELNVKKAKLDCLLRGDLEVNDALGVLKKMSEVYPVPLNDLWLDADDTVGGVRTYSAEASEASARVLDRKDKTGGKSPYYEYRDSCMTRLSQFRPEWIKQLRIVQSGDPLDPDVVLNNGHLMMQTTLFVGPVDFYWKDQFGKTHRHEMNTGDSNYISPFVPHSFTSRDPNTVALIIAVTFGGRVRSAFTEFARVGGQRVFGMVGNLRQPQEARSLLLKRHLSAECLTDKDLMKLTAQNLKAERVQELLSGVEPTPAETKALAQALNVRASDLQLTDMLPEEEVVVTQTADSIRQARHLATYTLAPLARNRHQPDLKTFDMEVLDSAAPGEKLECGLHTFVYHFGSEPVDLSWIDRQTKENRTSRLKPGDSAYVAPLIEHGFNVIPGVEQTKTPANPNGQAHANGRRLLLVRIPGQLTGDTLAEFASFAPSGVARVGHETMQWY